jgi:hypothetical protein
LRKKGKRSRVFVGATNIELIFLTNADFSEIKKRKKGLDIREAITNVTQFIPKIVALDLEVTGIRRKSGE